LYVRSEKVGAVFGSGAPPYILTLTILIVRAVPQTDAVNLSGGIISAGTLSFDMLIRRHESSDV
jgi:hypothetical protein